MSEAWAAVWNADLARGVLRVPRCTACATWNWYPLLSCRHCGNGEFAWVELAPRGQLHSWTRVHRRFTTWPIATPYLVGLVELADAPHLRLSCRIEAEGGDPVIGAHGRLEAGCEGEERFWRFRATP